jgi:cobalt-zinc-cadmium efflux system protein
MHDAGSRDGHQDHGHGHDHGDHGHAHGTGTDERRIACAFVIIFGFILVEVARGEISRSLALLADAGHMVSDTAALGMSWAALRIGRRPADSMRSFD